VLRLVADRRLPATQTEYRARWIRQPAETWVRPAALLPTESPVSLSSISDPPRNSRRCRDQSPLPRLAGDARMRPPSPIICLARTATARQSGLSLGYPDRIEEGEEGVRRNKIAVSYFQCSELSVAATRASRQEQAGGKEISSPA
jgi:hypothetical protein